MPEFLRICWLSCVPPKNGASSIAKWKFGWSADDMARTADKGARPAEALGQARLLDTMLRVGDLERSIEFYMRQIGLALFRREDYPDVRFTLAFVGYGDERSSAIIELSFNWGCSRYER